MAEDLFVDRYCDPRAESSARIVRELRAEQIEEQEKSKLVEIAKSATSFLRRTISDFQHNSRQEYFGTIRRYEAGENVSAMEVLKAALKYYVSNPGEYFRVVKARFKKD
jgi:hypothetical protein